MFPRLRAGLSEKIADVELAEVRLQDLCPKEGIVSWIANHVLGSEFILFCGAGISIPGPSFAPGFVELRDALTVAITRLLSERSVISVRQETDVSEAVKTLPRRTDITCPPEMVFSAVNEALGNDIVMNLLSCLDEGGPNENHIAIRRLATQKDSGLLGVITPNFDTYVERAFTGVHLSRHVPGMSEGDRGFPLLKPHGSLDKPTSIAVTMERVLVRLDDMPREALKRLVSGRTVLVVGYSGWDYDLFPLLVHAGRHWNTRIVWILWSEESMNAQVAKIQIALGNRCRVLNGQKRAVLAELGGLRVSNPPARTQDLLTRFAEAMRSCSNAALLSAFMAVVDPIGVPESAGIREHLCSKLLDEVEHGRIGSDTHKLKYLLKVSRYSEVGSTRETATDLGREIAFESAQDAWARQFEHLRSKGLDWAGVESELESELADIEFDMQEDFFPHLDDLPDPDRARRSLKMHQLIRKAEILLYMEEFDEADKLARHLLREMSFPRSGVSRGAWLAEDGKAEGNLRRIIAEVSAEHGNKQEAEEELCRSLDICWRELDFFNLDLLVDRIRQVAWLAEPQWAEKALALCTSIARLTGDRYSELDNLLSKLEWGFGTPQDFARAERLFSQLELDEDDRREFAAILTRHKDSSAFT